MAVLPQVLAGSSTWKQVGGRTCAEGYHSRHWQQSRGRSQETGPRDIPCSRSWLGWVPHSGLKPNLTWLFPCAKWLLSGLPIPLLMMPGRGNAISGEVLTVPSSPEGAERALN